jgi:RNA polymerase sigma-70 factor (ECF subfamily)
MKEAGMLTDPDDAADDMARAGPDNGLAALYHRHAGELRRFLAARSGDADLAEDLFQDLWIKVGARPSGPVSDGRAYLFRMANNLVLDHARSRQRGMARDRAWIDEEVPSSPLPEARPDPAPDAEAQLAKAQETLMLTRAMASLPPGARQALHLYRLEEHSQPEVAKIMGISLSGVEKHLALAMKHLRAKLLDCGLLGAAASEGAEPHSGGKTPGEQSS